MSTFGSGQVRRILLVLQSTSVGGMETLCVDLAGEYVRRGIEVRTVVPEGREFDLLATRFGAGGADVCRLDTDTRNGAQALARRWVRLLAVMHRCDPDVVHVHTGGQSAA